MNDREQEKEKRERAVAERLLGWYNRKHGAAFGIVARPDPPDFLCEDAGSGRNMAVEVKSLPFSGTKSHQAFCYWRSWFRGVEDQVAGRVRGEYVLEARALPPKLSRRPKNVRRQRQLSDEIMKAGPLLGLREQRPIPCDFAKCMLRKWSDGGSELITLPDLKPTGDDVNFLEWPVLREVMKADAQLARYRAEIRCIVLDCTDWLDTVNPGLIDALAGNIEYAGRQSNMFARIPDSGKEGWVKSYRCDHGIENMHVLVADEIWAVLPGWHIETRQNHSGKWESQITEERGGEEDGEERGEG